MKSSTPTATSTHSLAITTIFRSPLLQWQSQLTAQLNILHPFFKNSISKLKSYLTDIPHNIGLRKHKNNVSQVDKPPLLRRHVLWGNEYVDRHSIILLLRSRHFPRLKLCYIWVGKHGVDHVRKRYTNVFWKAPTSSCAQLGKAYFLIDCSWWRRGLD